MGGTVSTTAEAGIGSAARRQRARTGASDRWLDRQFIKFAVMPTTALMLCIFGLPLLFSGLLSFQGWAPEWLTRGITQMSFLGHFSAITRGVIDLRDVIYFLSIMIAFLGANAILIDLEKAE